MPYAQTIYVGTDTGRVWKTTDAGAHWTRLTGAAGALGERDRRRPADANHVYAAFSGYREGDDAANVYETHDGGATWANISQNLPNGPVEMITYDAAHDVLYAATDVGVFDHKDGDSAWYKISVGLPERAGTRRQALRRRQVPVRGDVRPQRVEAAAVHRRHRRRRAGRLGAGDAGAVARRAGARSARSRRAWRRTTPRTTTANVISTAGDAALSVREPGHLINGTFALPSPLEVSLSKASLDRAGLQRPGHDHVQAAHRRHRRAAHRQLLQDTDVHALDDEPVVRQSSRGASGMKRRSFPVDPVRSMSSTSATLT